MDKWCVAIFSIICIACWIISIIKDVRAVRRRAPYGKVFKKEFAEIIDDIFRAQKISDQTYIPAFVNNMLFKIEVDEYKPSGLEYSTIPMYRCYDIYINGEIVCREHIIKEWGKDKIWFEFSSKRERDEIITLVTEAHKPAEEILHKNNKELYERLGLVSKSFFDYSSSEDTPSHYEILLEAEV